MIAASVTTLMAGCSGLHSKTPSSSFAGLPICTNNQFLQKYNCDTINIEQAATSGDPDAQYALGYLYYYGIGLAQNDQAALIWIRKAAAQDQPLAKQALLIMQKSYTPGRASVTHPVNTSATAGYSEVSSSSSPPMSSQPSAPPMSPSSGPNLNGDSANNQTAPIKPLNSQLPSYNQNSGTGSPAIDMLQSSDNSGVESSNAQNASPSQLAANADDLEGQPAAAEVNPQTVEANVSNMNSTHVVPSNTAVNTANNTNFTPDERYLLSVNPGTYTIQLLGSHNLQPIIDFVHENNLKNQANYYQTAFQDKPWYLLIDGQYQNRAQAMAALAQLSPAVRAQNPWVRSFADIQQEIKQRASSV